MDGPEAALDSVAGRAERPEFSDWSDDELTRLAMAADPDAPLPDDAVSVWDLLGDETDGQLPSWYMPGPVAPVTRGRRWKRIVVCGLIVAFLAIDAFGLCTTYGPHQ